ncbi:MAG: DUF4337 domain-containing protein [Alphaproteobacteria bacterium]|nr:DUF4337 domain-containing protein [Alphaproteobacteria bacterium]
MAHGHHAEHGAEHGSNKKIAIFIAALAALLAIAETGGKSAQTAALFHNIDATNLWQFFQAKTIRQTTLRVAASTAALDPTDGLPAPLVEARKKQIGEWRVTADRYESEPDKQEGRQELMARAKAQEVLRDRSMAAYHLFELSSAAFQIAIVLASATIITGAGWLVFLAGGLSAAGLVLGGLAWFAPTLVHL